MKKAILSVISLLLFASLCACSFNVTTANFQNLKMAVSIDEDTMKPIVATDVFSPTAQLIYLTGTVRNAPEDTVIKAEWRYIENEAPIDIDSAELVTKDTNTDFQFNLSIPDNGWQIGKYEVKLSINGKPETAVNFEVKDGEVTTAVTTQASAKAAVFQDLKTASAIDENTYLPITVTSTFAADSPVIYLTGSLIGAEIGTSVKADWRYLEDDPAIDIDSATLTIELEETDFQFNLSIPNNGWPTGNYEVKLYIDDVFTTSIPFSVV